MNVFARAAYLVALASLAFASGAGVAASPASPRLAESTAQPADPEVRAQLSPRRYTTVGAEIGARVQRLAVAEGDAFRAGQVLVALDCGMQRAQLQRARVSLDVATKQLATQGRLAELNATGRQEVEVADGEVRKQKAEVAQTEVVLSKCSITAPFSGRVAEQKVREQQFVQAGQALLDIIDDSVLEVEFIMPSKWLSQVRTGSSVDVAVDETGKTYAARVLRLGARVDPVSQSVKVVAAIQGRPPELIAGMSGRVLVQRAR